MTTTQKAKSDLEGARLGDVIAVDMRGLRGSRCRQAKGPGLKELPRFVTTGVPVPAIPSWLLDPLWDQFSTLLPSRPAYDPSHPLGCHRPRTADRVIFEKLLQV